MIKTIEKIPRVYGCIDQEKCFKQNNEEDPIDFMRFLLNYHPWEAVMTVQKDTQFLISDTYDFDYMQDKGDNVVYPMINITKARLDEGCVVKFKEIVQDALIEYYPAEYRNDGASPRILSFIARAKANGAQLCKMKLLSGYNKNE